jgi:hypothetical protein
MRWNFGTKRTGQRSEQRSASLSAPAGGVARGAMANTARDRTQPAGTRTRRSLTFYLTAVQKPHGYWAAAMTLEEFERIALSAYLYIQHQERPAVKGRAANRGGEPTVAWCGRASLSRTNALVDRIDWKAKLPWCV